MAWRGRRARGADGWRWLGVALMVVMVGRGLWPRIAAGWRWLTGWGWDNKQVEELYGKKTNRGYGGGGLGCCRLAGGSQDRPTTRGEGGRGGPGPILPGRLTRAAAMPGRWGS